MFSKYESEWEILYLCNLENGSNIDHQEKQFISLENLFCLGHLCFMFVFFLILIFSISVNVTVSNLKKKMHARMTFLILFIKIQKNYDPPQK